MNEFKRFSSGQPASPRTVSLYGWALGPIRRLIRLTLIRDEPGDRFASLRDDDFFSRSDPLQQAGVAISQISDGCCPHRAP
jgi:hypothetical protein